MSMPSQQCSSNQIDCINLIPHALWSFEAIEIFLGAANSEATDSRAMHRRYARAVCFASRPEKTGLDAPKGGNACPTCVSAVDAPHRMSPSSCATNKRQLSQA